MYKIMKSLAWKIRRILHTMFGIHISIEPPTLDKDEWTFLATTLKGVPSNLTVTLWVKGGDLDDVRVWKRRLTSKEIHLVFEQGTTEGKEDVA